MYYITAMRFIEYLSPSLYPFDRTIFSRKNCCNILILLPLASWYMGAAKLLLNSVGNGKTVKAWLVVNDNTSASGFYKKMGFKKTVLINLIMVQLTHNNCSQECTLLLAEAFKKWHSAFLPPLLKSLSLYRHVLYIAHVKPIYYTCTIYRTCKEL